MTELNRRHLLAAAGALALPALTALPSQAAPSPEHPFQPQPGRWRSYEITTQVELAGGQGATRLWLPIPSINTDYQQSLESSWQGNATQVRQAADAEYGAKMLVADFAANEPHPTLSLTSRIRTQDRSTDWSQRIGAKEDAATLRYWTQPSELMPIDGIVHDTAKEITRFTWGDEAKTRKIYQWIVDNTYREPKVRGCGIGDIKAMLETGNLGGKCGDINALFVGLCRSVGVPARDVYGIRLAPSAFGYQQLSGNPDNLSGAQHCRAEVFLEAHGWVAMDPADVGKVMRLETKEWIKTTDNPLIAPVHRALFGGWEGNWLGFNTAHDVALPGSDGPRLAFFMYPQAENQQGRLDPLSPEQFRYRITSRELAV